MHVKCFKKKYSKRIQNLNTLITKEKYTAKEAVNLLKERSCPY
mgnify:CR=1 FL=1